MTHSFFEAVDLHYVRTARHDCSPGRTHADLPVVDSGPHRVRFLLARSPSETSLTEPPTGHRILQTTSGTIRTPSQPRTASSSLCSTKSPGTGSTFARACCSRGTRCGSSAFALFLLVRSPCRLLRRPACRSAQLLERRTSATGRADLRKLGSLSLTHFSSPSSLFVMRSFTGGYLEVSASFPGDANTMGFWSVPRPSSRLAIEVRRRED